MADVFFLNLPKTRLAYRIYTNADAPNADAPNANAPKDSKLVLLHGAGVAGELTWQAIIPHLTQWQWILVPDLKGMGQSYHHDGQEVPLSVLELAQDIQALTTHLDWLDFDLAGYSLGGGVALMLNQLRSQQLLSPINKMALIEPATLDREPLAELQLLRQQYRQAAKTIRVTGDVEQGIACFVDGVAPNRRKHPVAEAVTQSRLAHRPLGFSYALDAVSDLVDTFVEDPQHRQDLLRHSANVLLFAGGLSHMGLQRHYQQLSETMAGWQSIVLSGSDHSMPFQKPRQIAKAMNGWFG